MHEGEVKGEFINKNITQEMIMETAIGGDKNEFDNEIKES